MKKYVELKEFKIPSEVTDKLAELQEKGDQDNPATLGAAGFFDWLTTMSKTEGWRPVFQGFNYPFIVLEREVEEE